MKVLAVSQRVTLLKEHSEAHDSLDQRLITFINGCGCVPIPVPNKFSEIGSTTSAKPLLSWLEKVSPDGIILSGGNDIGQNHYRDNTEKSLLHFAKKKNLPALGICRGMQMMAVYSGIGLRKVMGHIRTRNNLAGEISREVNSYHAFVIDKCPDDYKVLAKSEDGEIEAIKHKELFWEGWMWHPEREKMPNQEDIKRFRQLFKKQKIKNEKFGQ